MANTSTNIFPFVPILTLILITLKLTGHLVCSWWWVLSPIWIGVVAVIIIFILICSFLFIKSLIEAYNL